MQGAGPPKRGINLIEVVIASFILITCVVGLATVFTTHYRALNQSRTTLVGNNLAQKTLEELLSLGMQATDLGYPKTVTMDSRVADRIVKTDYTIQVTTAKFHQGPGPVPPVQNQDSLDIIVLVTWKEGTITHKVRYESCVTEGGG